MFAWLASHVTLATGVPRRAIDTRVGARVGAWVAAGGRLCFAVAGAPGDVAIVNLTPVQAMGPGHGLLVGGDTTGRTEASNVNDAPGTVDPNLAIAAVGSDGEVCFENADRAAVHLVADHLVTLDAGAVVLAGPTRVLDTRD